MKGKGKKLAAFVLALGLLLSLCAGALAEEYGVAYLNSDFKKKNGYKRSVELSGQYGMYRQYYCGCVFSKRERDAQIAAKAAAQGI